MQFDTFRKVGKHWRFLSTITAPDSRKAALRAAKAHNAEYIGVRPADCLAVKLFLYRFSSVRF